jgi:oxygen-independent coproporphyrinogen III oxidase
VNQIILENAAGIYLHFPFCLAKCPYCNFVSQPLPPREDVRRYLQAEKLEIAARCKGRIQSIYFGGGTPSLIPPGEMALILEKISLQAEVAPDCEITLEVNPATLAGKTLKKFRQLGINRLSLGVQSLHPDILSRLGRVHSAGQAILMLRAAREAGFENLSCDLIYGIPWQTREEFKQDLEQICSFAPEHVSLYALTLEPETLFFKLCANKSLPAPDDDLAADMYELACDYLSKQGIYQYEISNFARPGKECRHNLIYWTMQPYFGIGTAAHSYLAGERSWNSPNYKDYCENIFSNKTATIGVEKLKQNQEIAEELIVRLRLNEGVNFRKMQEKYPASLLMSVQNKLSRFIKQDLLQWQDQNLQLTPRGRLLSNIVFRELV